jgi:hypothetical protein
MYVCAWRFVPPLNRACNPHCFYCYAVSIVSQWHSTACEAIEVARRACAKSTMLTHFSARYPKLPPVNESVRVFLCTCGHIPWVMFLYSSALTNSSVVMYGMRHYACITRGWRWNVRVRKGCLWRCVQLNVALMLCNLIRFDFSDGDDVSVDVKTNTRTSWYCLRWTDGHAWSEACTSVRVVCGCFMNACDTVFLQLRFSTRSLMRTLRSMYSRCVTNILPSDIDARVFVCLVYVRVQLAVGFSFDLLTLRPHQCREMAR